MILGVHQTLQDSSTMVVLKHQLSMQSLVAVVAASVLCCSLLYTVVGLCIGVVL